MTDDSAQSDDRTTAPHLREIADVFVGHANFTLGGGSATTAVLHGQLVVKRGWVSDSLFTLCFALGRLIPGTNVLAFCTGVGWLLRRLPGALVALLAASIPCTAIVVALTAVFRTWQANHLAQAAIHGAVAAAVAITAKTSWVIARPTFKCGEPGARRRVVLIGGAAFTLHAGLGVPAIQVLLLDGLVGALWSVSRP